LSWTNEKGDFGVSNRFLVDGTNGEVTISASSFNLSGLNQIGPFSRNGGLSTVGVQLKEVSDNINMVSSLGVPDANTAPTQTAVVTYINQQLTQGLPNGAIVNDTAFYFAGTSPFPTVRIDSTPIKVGDVLWDKVNRTWTSYDGTGWNNNPTIQNGVYQFVQTTAPTQRAVGVPLVAGDRWYKPSDNGVGNTTGWWSWTGSLWVSPLLEITNMQLTNITTTSSGFYGTINTVGSILVTRAVAYTIVSNTNDASNYWTLDVSLQAPQANSRSVLASFSTQNDTVNFRLGKAVSLNTVVASGFPDNLSGMTLYLVWTKVGSPGFFYAGCSLSYRHIHP
jgi:hypothetical protein